MKGAVSDDEVFLTGATGFIGGHVLDALLDAGYSVRALVRTPGRLPSRPGVAEVVGDVTRSGQLVGAMSGCRLLIHCAAVYSFSPSERAQIHATNAAGTAGILVAARLAGVERAVVTSSSATVGPARRGRPATEEDHADEHRGSAYHSSKIAGERAALAARVPAVVILPTAPVGAHDWKPTPTGTALLTFLRGRVLASVDGGINIVAVRDVAEAHVAALTRGQPRRRYLVGGENLSFDQLWRRLAAVSGRRAPRRRMPHAVALMAGFVDEARCRVVRGSPVVPLEGVRMARHHMYVDSRRSVDELGVAPSSVDTALEDAVRWYREHGYVAA
ncbi:MAG TPA: NAD-dependent epimerase/dehydratase family protein [Candidatus Dormibacteraeota bacterium]